MEQYDILFADGYRFISFRPRSVKEVRDFLEKKLKKRHTTAPSLVDAVIKRLTDLGHLDDAKFAAWWVEQRVAFRPKGKRLIAQELKQKGINYTVEIDEVSLAKKAVEKKRRIWEKLPKIDQKKKFSAYLMRRGFSWDVVDEVLKKQ